MAKDAKLILTAEDFFQGYDIGLGGGTGAFGAFGQPVDVRDVDSVGLHYDIYDNVGAPTNFILKLQGDLGNDYWVDLGSVTLNAATMGILEGDTRYCTRVRIYYNAEASDDIGATFQMVARS